MEKLTYLNYKVGEYKTEKDKLTKNIEDASDDRSVIVEKLENDIKNYKNMTESCVKTCSQLAEEVMTLRKEMDKYSDYTMSSSSTVSTNNYSTQNSGSKIKKQIKTNGVGVLKLNY